MHLYCDQKSIFNHFKLLIAFNRTDFDIKYLYLKLHHFRYCYWLTMYIRIQWAEKATLDRSFIWGERNMDLWAVFKIVFELG